MTEMVGILRSRRIFEEKKLKKKVKNEVTGLENIVLINLTENFQNFCFFGPLTLILTF